jgi:GxxExxY protein
MLDVDVVTGMIVDAAYVVRRKAGPGLFESVYRDLLAAELVQRGLEVEKEVIVPMVIEGTHFDRGFRADLIVDRRVIVEVKSAERLPAVATKQLLTYLRLLDLHVGFVINFGAPLLNDGIKRVVNEHVPSPESPLRNRA